MKKDSLRLYAVTDRAWLGDRSLPECVESAIKGGATFVQLREKNMSSEKIADSGREIKKITDRYNVPFVVNDDVQAAIMCDADGVHIGQDDMPPYEVRKLLGNDKIIGVSVHTVDEALTAEKDGADYLGVGAMLATDTKTDADIVSVEMLREICAAVDIPVVIIGGLKAENIESFSGCGASGAAVVSALFAQNDIEAAAKKLRKVCDRL